MREAEERELDRYIERWARHLILVDGDEVRRLTEEEIQSGVRAGKVAEARRRSNRSAQRSVHRNERSFKRSRSS